MIKYTLINGKGEILFESTDRREVEIDMETRCDFHSLNDMEIVESDEEEDNDCGALSCYPNVEGN